MSRCDDCEHKIFDETWGEIKCKEFSRRIYEPVEECEKYEKTTEKE